MAANRFMFRLINTFCCCIVIAYFGFEIRKKFHQLSLFLLFLFSVWNFVKNGGKSEKKNVLRKSNFVGYCIEETCKIECTWHKIYAKGRVEIKFSTFKTDFSVVLRILRCSFVSSTHTTIPNRQRSSFVLTKWFSQTIVLISK